MNYSINSLSAKNEQVLLENNVIRGQIAELRSLDRIEELAVRDLGMVKNERVDYMILSSTIVSEGKIRMAEDGSVEEEPDVKPLDSVEAAIGFLLSFFENR